MGRGAGGGRTAVGGRSSDSTAIVAAAGQSSFDAFAARGITLGGNASSRIVVDMGNGMKFRVPASGQAVRFQRGAADIQISRRGNTYTILSGRGTSKVVGVKALAGTIPLAFGLSARQKVTNIFTGRTVVRAG